MNKDLNIDNLSTEYFKGFKAKIYPNKEQQEKIIKFCNTSRFAYNWTLNMKKEN